MYGEILRGCRVVHGELSDEDRSKVEKFGNLLRTTRKVTDPATGERREVTDDGPMVKAYHEKHAAYLHAVTRYNARRVGGGPGWTADAQRCRMDVGAAMDDWVCCGYRNEVDQVTAYLDQIGRRAMVPWRRDLVELYDGGLLDGDGGRFHYTTLVPGDFATAACWVDVTFDALDAFAGLASWRSGADGVDFGLGGVTEVHGFVLHVQLSQVVISRLWFYPQFFANRGWTLDGEPVCDGGDPPSGRLVGYPVAALFARDLRIASAELATACRALGPGHGVGWGPFQLAGARPEDGCISVPGIQLLGLGEPAVRPGAEPATTTGYRAVRLNQAWPARRRGCRPPRRTGPLGRVNGDPTVSEGRLRLLLSAGGALRRSGTSSHAQPASLTPRR